MAHTSTPPRHSEQYKGRDLGDEYMFYDHEGDRVHVLNGTARAIYLLCDGTRSAEDVASAFGEMYDLDDETARRDAAETIRRLIELGVVER